MDQFVEQVSRYQAKNLVSIGRVDVSTPRASVTVSASGESPLNLQLLARLACECNLDWLVRLFGTPGNAVFVARPMPDTDDAAPAVFGEVKPGANSSAAARSVASALRIPPEPPQGFSVETRETDASQWICVVFSGERQVVLTREMLDGAVRHARTAQAQLQRSAVLLEVPTDGSRKRPREDGPQSPEPKRRA
jgi:hypothetical protein